MLKPLVHRELVGFSQGSAFAVCFFNCSLGAVQKMKKNASIFSGGYIDTVNRGFGQIYHTIAKKSLFSGDDDYAQFGDYDSYGQIEEEANKFGFESNYPMFCRLFLTKSAFLWGKLWKNWNRAVIFCHGRVLKGEITSPIYLSPTQAVQGDNPIVKK